MKLTIEPTDTGFRLTAETEEGERVIEGDEALLAELHATARITLEMMDPTTQGDL